MLEVIKIELKRKLLLLNSALYANKSKRGKRGFVKIIAGIKAKNSADISMIPKHRNSIKYFCVFVFNPFKFIIKLTF